MNHWTRRQFMVGCSSAVAAMAGSRLVGLSFADDQVRQPSSDRDLLVVIFLRGGMDGLNFVAPVNDRDYVAARAAGLRLAETGENAGLPLKNGPAGLDFRIHSKAAALRELYDAGHMAVVHACGLTNGTRSHFEAQDMMEHGVADTNALPVSAGWLTRHLAAIGAAGLVPAVAIQDALPASLFGSTQAAAVANLEEFGLRGSDQRLGKTMRQFYSGAGRIHSAGAQAFRAIDAVNKKLRKSDGESIHYDPEQGVNYPGGELSDALRTVACLAKADLGLEVAAVDFGGWDTHQNQAGYFPQLIDQLSSAIGSFYNDMSKRSDRLSIVVMSEFGRRLKSNQSDGTDHGHGNVMLALGGGVKGGRIYGDWPGLATDQLDDRADLAVRTDYRTVLAELCSRRLGNPDNAKVFPGLKALEPLGVYQARG